MSIRDKRQKEFSEEFMDSGFGIMLLAPRFGKIKMSINILNEIEKRLKRPLRILICYPDLKIMNSWLDDFKKWKYKHNNSITYTTYLSLKNNIGVYDVIIFDEIHLMSPAQIVEAKKLLDKNAGNFVLGLTGTLSQETRTTLRNSLGLDIIREYSIATAITEGVITDYEINVIKVPLDTTKKVYKKNTRTEKQQYNALTFVIDKLEREGQETFMLRLKRMRLLQDSLSKLNKTKELLSSLKDERCLVFCGKSSSADSIGCNVYHSHNKDDDVFNNFITGKGDNHLAVVKMMNQGITVKPIQSSVINYFDSNPENLAQKISRLTNFEYDRPDKKAVIYIITSDEETELKWLRKALVMFDQSKIKYHE